MSVERLSYKYNILLVSCSHSLVLYSAAIGAYKAAVASAE